MAGHRKPAFGKLTKASRDRAARIARRDYGLTRRQARERYNRGTYRPFARRPEDRAPKNAPVRPPGGPDVLENLKRRALANMDRYLGDRFQYNRSTVVDAVENHASEKALRRMAGASEDELETWAGSQRWSKRYKRWIPASDFVKNLGFYSDREWHNVFWYH